MNAFKQLPWGSLFLAALLSVTTLKALDYAIAWSLESLKSDTTLLKLLVTPAGGLLLFGCGGLALGGLGVLFLERIGSKNVRLIHANLLWALALCLVLCLWIFSQLPIGGLGLVAFSEVHMIGLLVGVFWQGRAYWR